MSDGTAVAVDLFCGPGGLSTGFEKAGFTIASALDVSESAVKTYSQNHGHDPLHADIRETEAGEVIEDIGRNGYEKNEVDVVIGGPPCKGFSLANMQTRSPENPMNDLFMHFLRIVQDISPSVALMENVPGFLSMGSEEGEVREILVQELREMGYSVSYEVLSAERFGVPQTRKRVFFLGVKKGAPIFPNPTHNEGGRQATLTRTTQSLKPVVTTGEAISDLPELPEGGGGSEKMKYDQEPHSEYAQEMRAEVGDTVYNHRSTVNRENTVERFKHVPQGGNWEDIPAELMDSYTDRSRTHGHIHYRLEEDEPALTVANFRKSMMTHPTQDRLLSVREAARLQSFPDNYRFVSDRFSDKQQMVADAVPVKLAEALAEEIYDHLCEHEEISVTEPTLD